MAAVTSLLVSVSVVGIRISEDVTKVLVLVVSC